MNKDQVKGRAKETGGKVKKNVGEAVGNEKLEFKGKVQEVTGKTQAEYGDLKNQVSKGD